MAKSCTLNKVEFQDNLEVFKIITSFKLNRKSGLNIVRKIQECVKSMLSISSTKLINVRILLNLVSP